LAFLIVIAVLFTATLRQERILVQGIGRLIEVNPLLNPFAFKKRVFQWTTGRNYPQVNLEDPPEGPQEEDDSDPFEEQKLEIILSGFRPPQ
jgi:hypothetical protein